MGESGGEGGREKNVLRETDRYIHTYIHTYIDTYIHTYIDTYTRTYIYIHTYIHTYLHTHIYIHTHTPLMHANKHNTFILIHRLPLRYRVSLESDAHSVMSVFPLRGVMKGNEDVKLSVTFSPQVSHSHSTEIMSFCLPVLVSTCLFMYLSICPCVCVPIYLFVGQSVCLCLCVCLSLCLSVRLFVSMFIFLSVFVKTKKCANKLVRAPMRFCYLSVCPSVRLSVCQCVHVFVTIIWQSSYRK